MQRHWNATEIEYRDPQGTDRLVQVDLWSDVGGHKAVLVLRDLPTPGLWLLAEDRLNGSDLAQAIRPQATAALDVLNRDWLPYLLRPDAQVLVLVLRPREDGEKARALVWPLSA